MSISSVESLGFAPLQPLGLTPAGATPATGATPGVDFASTLAQGLERLEGLNDKTDTLAVKAATGDLSQIHDYTITATEAAVSTELTTAVRNKALEAFQEIMRISI